MKNLVIMLGAFALLNHGRGESYGINGKLGCHKGHFFATLKLMDADTGSDDDQIATRTYKSKKYVNYKLTGSADDGLLGGSIEPYLTIEHNCTSDGKTANCKKTTIKCSGRKQTRYFQLDNCN